jgi:hypothetical protein
MLTTLRNPDGTFTCPIPNAAYCAGDSLKTNIIFRCIGTKAQPGNCNDNLAGDFPFGVNYAPCWQPDATSGQAACSKNCIVYGGSGNYNGTFTLPGCVPTSSTTASSSTTSAGNVTSSVQTTPTSSPVISYTTVTNQYTTVTVPCDNGTPIYTPPGVTFSSPTAPAASGGAPTPPPSGGNGTATTPSAPPANGPGGSATATPVGPTATTTSRPPTFSGAATANQAGSVVAAAGLLIAYFL